MNTSRIPNEKKAADTGCLGKRSQARADENTSLPSLPAGVNLSVEQGRPQDKSGVASGEQFIPKKPEGGSRSNHFSLVSQRSW
ncbi:hypothetical protein AGOR_G00071860 [Albula goreensis]|uniref:Uncharacterized protein n=1 Tax=Albula goreensis TaxID=1534307 RepID=A0A8T3DRG1_9TELE|nr:hypothetical protein AGOR_G00071860 [Albula goreensis]